MDKKIVQVKVVAGAVISDNKVLIIQRSSDESLYPNMWELPSGKREPLEPTDKALMREIKEETGLNIEIIKILSVFDYQIEKEDEIRDATQINYLMKPAGEANVKISSEHQNYTWISMDEIDNYDIAKETKNVIKEVLSEEI
ncbi:nucleoside triphosphatase NudI [bacterium BMS3Abin15]|nr:nucleoside triphosphatase NudI [bacterium BMS3Abin15]HDH07483.1 NUDIX hydrolase [Candidatus Moranbacteria bacterium]